MSLTKSDKDYEPLQPTPTVGAAALYGGLTVLLALVAFILISSSGYRENAGMTLEKAQRSSRAVLPLVLGLAAASGLLGLQTWLCWHSSRWTVTLGTLCLGLTGIVTGLVPLSFRGYAVSVLLVQAVALGLYLYLKSRAVTQSS